MSPADPIERLLDYHARVRRQLQRLRRIEEDLRQRDQDSLEEAVVLANEVVDCFGHEGRLHAVDESASLFPRLERLLGERPGAHPELARALPRLAAEHARPAWEWVALRDWLWVLGTPEPVVSVDRLVAAREELERHFLPHLELEEAVVFPAARELLDAEDLAAILREMDERRERGLTPDEAAVP